MADGGERVDDAQARPPKARESRRNDSGALPVSPRGAGQVLPGRALPQEPRPLGRHGDGERCTSAEHASCPDAAPEPRGAPRRLALPVPAGVARPVLRGVARGRPTCRGASRRTCAAPTTATASASCSSRPPAPSARGPALPAADSRRSRRRSSTASRCPGGSSTPTTTCGSTWATTASCHLGVDAFLARLVGEVERLTFLTVKGDVRPAVVLTVGGVDLTLVFAQPLPLVAANTRLRSALDQPDRRPVRPRLALHRPVGRGRRPPARRRTGRAGRARSGWRPRSRRLLERRPRAPAAPAGRGSAARRRRAPGPRVPAPPRARGRPASLRRVLPPAVDTRRTP